MNLDKTTLAAILIFGILTSFSSCESYELLGLVFNDDTTELKITAPEPATVIKKIVANDCYGTSTHRMFDVYLTPDAFAFYCGGGSSLDYRFNLVDGITTASVIFNMDQQVTSFTLPGGTKYSLELYTALDSVLISTSKPFFLPVCGPGFTSGNGNSASLTE